MEKSLFGWVASSITLIYKLPQIYKLYKTKKSNDLSLFSFKNYLVPVEPKPPTPRLVSIKSSTSTKLALATGHKTI